MQILSIFDKVYQFSIIELYQYNPFVPLFTLFFQKFLTDF